MPKKTAKRDGLDPKRSFAATSKVGKNPGRIPDKLPMRAPRRPEAARFESGRRTGAKKRLGR